MTNSRLVSFELREHYLLVIGHGKRDSLSEMAQASEVIYDKVLETGSKYVLIDYRYLIVNVNLTEAFNIVKRYEVIQPHIKNLIIAGVFTPGRGKEFGRYWKEIANQRGFTIEVFDEIDAAEKWLLDMQKSK